MLFCSEFSKLMWRLKKELNIALSEAYQLAVSMFSWSDNPESELPSLGSEKDQFTLITHFEELEVLYQGEGRRYAFKRATEILKESTSLWDFLRAKYIGPSIRKETFEVLLTHRSERLRELREREER